MANLPDIDEILVEYPRSQWSIKNSPRVESVIGRLDGLTDPVEREYWRQNGHTAFQKKHDLMRDKRTINILMVAADTYGCGYARIQRPAKYLNRIPHIVAFPTITVPVELIFWSHIIVWQRQHGDNAFKSCEIARRLNKIQIFEIDDNLHAIPKDNPAYNFYNQETASYQNMLRWMKNCDLVTVTKEKLGEFYRDLAGIQYKVLPNSLDFEDFPNVDLSQRKNDKVRIGWAGSETHYGDLRIVSNVFRKLKKIHGNRIEFVLMGSDGVYRVYEKADQNEPDATNNLRVKRLVGDVLKGVKREFHPFVETEDYYKALCHLNLDIAVVPLTPSTFNLSGKSNLKYLEMSAAKIPCVLSKNTVYDEVRHGENGFLAGNEQEWLQSLNRLIRDGDLRHEIAGNAYDYVKTNYDFANQVQKWKDVYFQAIQTKHDAVKKRRAKVGKDVLVSALFVSDDYNSFLNGGSGKYFNHLIEGLKAIENVRVYPCSKESLSQYQDKEFDIVISSHNIVLEQISKLNIKGFKVHICHGIYPPEEQPVHGADRYVSVSKEVQSHLREKGFPSTVIDQPYLFPALEEKSLRKAFPLTVLYIKGNSSPHGWKIDDDRIQIIESDRSKPILEQINKADLCIAIGRGVIEAVSLFKPVIIADTRYYIGAVGDGLLTPEIMHQSLEFNFNGKRFSYPATDRFIYDQIMSYVHHFDLAAMETIYNEFSRRFDYREIARQVISVL